jgi:hypothetical protein
MTPERKKWWDSLPKREKMLRKKIWEIKGEISWAKHRLQLGCFTPKATKLIIAGIKKQKVTLTALKHELDRTTVAVHVGCLEEGVPIYRCEKCGNMFENFEQSYCCWCGRKIVGWK